MVKGNSHRSAPMTGTQRHLKKNRQIHMFDRRIPAPAHLIARPAVAKSKHHTYYEFADNKDKKKKLELETTNNKHPSAGFTFVPIGNPELTQACKELARELGALVYIVSSTKEDAGNLGQHVHRIGYHFRSSIVETCASSLDLPQSKEYIGDSSYQLISNVDRIPDSQDEINAQADAAIRDLFPRIPNTDRQMIIDHAFRKGTTFLGKPVVGLSKDLTLSRRVQLAVIAHIRHQHTRYDELLRETTWENARKTVESLCLDILVKWRGDEETGRDQLEEVLREIVVISDSEDSLDDDDTGDDDDDDDEEDSDSSSEGKIEETLTKATMLEPEETLRPMAARRLTISPDQVVQEISPAASISELRNRHLSKRGAKRHARKLRRGMNPRTKKQLASRKDRTDRKHRQGLKRYAAWQQALNRRGISRDPDVPVDSSEVVFYPEAQPIHGTSGFQRKLRVYNDDPLDDSVPASSRTRASRPVGLPFFSLEPSSTETLLPAQPQKMSRRRQPRDTNVQHDEQPSDRMQNAPRHANGVHINHHQQRSVENSLIEAGSRLGEPINHHPRADISQDMPLPSIESSFDRSHVKQSGQASNPHCRVLRRVLHEPLYEQARPFQSQPEVIFLEDTMAIPPRRGEPVQGFQYQFAREARAFDHTRRVPEQRFIPVAPEPSAILRSVQPDHDGGPFSTDSMPTAKRTRVVRVVRVLDVAEPYGQDRSHEESVRLLHTREYPRNERGNDGLPINEQRYIETRDCQPRFQHDVQMENGLTNSSNASQLQTSWAHQRVPAQVPHQASRPSFGQPRPILSQFQGHTSSATQLDVVSQPHPFRPHATHALEPGPRSYNGRSVHDREVAHHVQPQRFRHAGKDRELNNRNDENCQPLRVAMPYHQDFQPDYPTLQQVVHPPGQFYTHPTPQTQPQSWSNPDFQQSMPASNGIIIID